MSFRTRSPVNLYPFHHVEIDDYWNGLYDGWRSVIAEALGTMMYVFSSVGISIAAHAYAPEKDNGFHRTLLTVALGDGLAFMCFVFAFQRLSGGYLNPATTWGALITRRIGILRGIAYILAQVGGGLLGALLVAAATPDNLHGRLGSHFWDDNLSDFDGFLLVTILTAFFVFVVFATFFDPHNIGELAAVPIGFTLTFVNLVGLVFVGPPINPARVFASAVVYNTYDHIWVYWAAPAAGSTIAALVYVLIFLSRPAPITAETPSSVKYTSYTIPTETTRLGGVAAV